MPHDIYRLAYAVIDPPQGSDKKARWNKVGVTFANQDGSETVLLDALPTNGKLVLQLPAQDEKSAGDQTGS